MISGTHRSVFNFLVLTAHTNTSYLNLKSDTKRPQARANHICNLFTAKHHWTNSEYFKAIFWRLCHFALAISYTKIMGNKCINCFYKHIVQICHVSQVTLALGPAGTYTLVWGTWIVNSTLKVTGLGQKGFR